MRSARVAWVVLATLAGVATGWAVAQGRQRFHREDLFSARVARRRAALGFLASRPGVETLHLLRDYLGWERDPVLRRRAQALATRMETRLA